MSTAHRHSPSAPRRQTVTARPLAVTGTPSGPFMVTTLLPSRYANCPSGEKTAAWLDQVIRNPGICRLLSTYLRKAALPTIAGRAGGRTTASSVQNERMRSRPKAQRPWSAARHLHGERKGGGGSRCRDARSGSLERMVRRFWLMSNRLISDSGVSRRHTLERFGVTSRCPQAWVESAHPLGCQVGLRSRQKNPPSPRLLP